MFDAPPEEKSVVVPRMRRRIADFDADLEFSKSALCLKSDIETIKSMIPRCTGVEKAPEDLDRLGIDYIAHLEGKDGCPKYIDVKTRRDKCKGYWTLGQPELALETISVVGSRSRTEKIGWTLDTAKQTNLVLFKFHPDDTEYAYMFSFDQLRIAFELKKEEWKRTFRWSRQPNDGYLSECIFVPVRIVTKAIVECSVKKAVNY